MLTVRFIAKSTGHESVFEVDSVVARCNNPGFDLDRRTYVLHYMLPGHSAEEPTNICGPGMAYIMNRDGKTVARYTIASLSDDDAD